MVRVIGCAVLASAMAFAAPPPQAVISNGMVRATIYLPDAENGYYRGARFDWSGVVGDLEFAGHRFFGPWQDETDPTVHDRISGPVEEFRSGDGALGFAEAKPNQLFVKIGVGLLRKPDDKPYQFSRNYQIVGHGQWIIRPSAYRIEFVQELKGGDGYSYRYQKTVRLAARNPELILEHSLKNIGKRTIDTDVYDHDFFLFDKEPTGPATSVQFAFKPVAKEPLSEAAAIDGDRIVYRRELKPEHDTVAGYLDGYGDSKKENMVRVENRNAMAGVLQKGDFPIAKLYFWSIRRTVCPEIYGAFHIRPGKTAHWRTTYAFYALPKAPGTAKKRK